MKYYLCIKGKPDNQTVNWFITYTFYSNYADKQTNNQFAYGNEFTVGQIYSNRNEDFHDVVYDNNGNRCNIGDVREYLADFDFVIDERVNSLVQRKGERFSIDIAPLSKKDNNVNYLITCRYTHTNGITYYTQNINISQYEGAIFGLKMMRKNDRITNIWRDVVRYGKNKIK